MGSQAVSPHPSRSRLAASGILLRRDASAFLSHKGTLFWVLAGSPLHW